MGIFDRVGRVMSANFNALIERAEDPRKNVEQTLADMKAAVVQARDEVVRSVAAEKQLRRKVEELDVEVGRWAKRAELAVQHSDDALAREALLQKKRLTEERDRAEALRAEQRGIALEVKRELERMEQKLAELTAKKSVLVARAEQAKAGEGAGAVGGEAFSEFRRMEQQIEGVDHAIAAQREVEDALRGPGGMTQSEVEARFRALEGGAVPAAPGGEPVSEVDEELAALKRRVRIGT